MAHCAGRLLVLRDLTLIDGTGSLPRRAAVLVEGPRILEVRGPVGSLPKGAEVIDCRGQTLLPGLIDAHVHVGAVEANIMEQQRRLFPSVLVIRSLGILKETLEQGFTTVRDAGGADPGFREAVRQGLAVGPRLSVSGQALSQTGGHGDPRLPTEAHPSVPKPGGLASVVCDGVDAVRAAAREQLRQGVDHIKIMAAGGCMSPSDELDTSQYCPEELRAAVWEAESAGKYVMAHCYSDRSILNAVEAGVRTIEHGNLLTEKGARAMKEAGAYLVPTVVTYVKISDMGRELGIPGENVRKIDAAREMALEALGIAFKAGVKIGSGSDLLGPMQIFKGAELALQARVLGPMGAIVAATRTNAEILRLEHDLGTVEPGKLADLILLDGDPLEDMTLFERYRDKITLIIQGGNIYKNLLA